MKRKALTALLLVFLLAGQGSAEIVSSPRYSPENIRSFISFLIRNKDYYRASVELRRYHHFYPTAAPASRLAVTGEFLLLQGKQYRAVFSMPAYFGSGPGLADTVFFADSCLLTGNYNQANTYIRQAKKNYGSEIGGIIMRRKVYHALMTGVKGDMTSLNDLITLPEADEYRSLITKGESLMALSKSPILGAGLGIIPGMGYIYAGETGTGVLSFVMISLCATLSYLGFRYKTEAAGIFFGAVATFFYTGSIMGGYRGVKKHNATIAGKVENQAYRELDIQGDQRFLLRKYGLKGL